MIFATFFVSLNVGGMLKRVSAVFVMFLLPFIAAAATCPSGYSEFSVNDGHMIVPMSEQCPDGLVQLYTVSDCADADAGSVCATCGSGYALGNSASCVELCSADSKQIHFGNKLSFNLLKKPGTKPALNFLTPKNQACYVDLASGTASGLNFELPDGTQYHAVNNSGGYRVCAAGYTLDYDCGVGGGVPPESQSLLSGYWYTVPSGLGNCRVPEGMRFSGWYMDGKKQAPYTIHSYNFNMNKTLTAMFSDNTKYNVNYFCATNDMVPVYTDEVVFGESVAPKTNMCPYDIKKTEPFAWIEPFSQEEINLFISALDADVDLSDLSTAGFLKPYFGAGEAVIGSEAEVFVLALFIYGHINCVSDSEMLAENPEVCAALKLLADHTYFDPDVLADADAESLALLYKDIYSEEDVDLVPLYNAALYNMTWDCGDYFSVFGGYDFDGETRYGWTVEYRCEPSYYGYINGISFVGWEVDGVLYEGWNITYNWTEDKTAIGIFDYDLNATFDCGEYGTLSSGESTVTYSGRGNAKDKIPLNVSAQCKPNAGKKFVGWSLPYYSSRTFGAGSVIDWLNIIVARNEQGIENPSDDFVAVYEDVVDVNYYCSASDMLPTYTNQYSANTTSAPLRQSGCSYDAKKYEFGGWYTPFTAEEVAKLKGYSFDTKYPEYWDDIEPMFIRQTDNYILNRDNWFIMAALWAGYSSTNDDPGLKYLAQILQKHWYIKGYSTSLTLSGNIDLYVFYTGKYYSLDFDCGVGNYEFWDDWNTGYYGATQKLCDSCSLSGYNSAGLSFAGWEIDGEYHDQCEPFVWNWTKNQTAIGIYQYDMTANFDCGADGVLSSGDAIVKNNSRGNSTDAIPLNITAQCKPNSGKKFVGWSNNGKAYNVGQTLNWLDYVGESLIEFTAVYEDVIDVNYYCSAADATPTYTDQYSANTTSAPLRQSGCSYDTKKYELSGWYTLFTDEEVAKLKSYSFDTKYPEYWNEIEPMFVNQTENYILDRDNLFVMLALWAGYQSTNNDPGLKYLAELLQKHWYVKGNSTSLNLSGNVDLYAFYTGKSYSVNFDCGIGEYELWDDFNTGYYGAPQKFCHGCSLGDYNSSGWSFAGWDIDGKYYDYCGQFVWEWTENKTAIGVYDFDMTAKFNCGTDGVLLSGATSVSYNGRGDGTDIVPIDVTTKCTPKEGKAFVGWSNDGKTYADGEILNWMDYVGESVIEFTAVYEDVVDLNYYCLASDLSPTFVDKYPKNTANVELRTSGCVDYDSERYAFYGWFTPFTDEEVAKLKSYSFHTKYKDYWAIIEPTFVNHTSSYANSYETVFMLTGLYAGYGVDTNDDGVKYLTTLLQKHWYIAVSKPKMDLSDATSLYGFYYKI